MFENGQACGNSRALPGTTDELRRIRAGARARWAVVVVCFSAMSSGAILACGQRTDIGSGSPDLRQLQSSSASSGTATGTGTSSHVSSSITSTTPPEGGAEAGAPDGGGGPSSDAGDAGRG